MNTDSLIFAALAMVTVGGIFYVFVYPHLSGDARAEKRQAALRSSGAATNKRVIDRNVDAAARRKQVAESLKELDQRTRSKKVTLEARLSQAGLEWTKGKFFIISGVLGAIVGFLVFFVSGNIIYFVPGALVGGFGIPNWMISFLKKKRTKKFVDEFPNAVDVIIRGIKAGLPLGDCIRIIASEATEPVRSEFRQIVESTTLGLSIAEGCERMAERVPVSESNFFSIVINIQQKAGGNLSEALGNLSRVLRDRKKMQLKVKAMSSEAKASAGIIGCLPFLVTFFVYLSSPRYIELLWITSTGRMVLAVSGFWMFIGLMSMRKMVNFDM
jgi:tight adherence protein B